MKTTEEILNWIETNIRNTESQLRGFLDCNIKNSKKTWMYNHLTTKLETLKQLKEWIMKD